MPFGYGNLKTRLAETTGGAAETVEKLKLNTSTEAEEKSLYKKRIKPIADLTLGKGRHNLINSNAFLHKY